MTVRFWLLLGTFAIGMNAAPADEVEPKDQETKEVDTAETDNTDDWKPKLLIVLQTDKLPTSHEEKEVKVPAYPSEPEQRDRVASKLSQVAWRDAKVQITKINLVHVFCDQAELSIAGTSESPTYKLKCDGPMFVEKAGVRINCESGTYEDGELKLTNVRIDMADSKMTAAEFAISVPKVFSAHTEPFNQSLETWTPALCRLNVATPGPVFVDPDDGFGRTARRPTPDRAFYGDDSDWGRGRTPAFLNRTPDFSSRDAKKKNTTPKPAPSERTLNDFQSDKNSADADSRFFDSDNTTPPLPKKKPDSVFDEAPER